MVVLTTVLALAHSSNAEADPVSDDSDWTQPAPAMGTADNQFLEKFVRDPVRDEVHIVFNNKRTSEPEYSSVWPENATLLARYNEDTMSFTDEVRRGWIGFDTNMNIYPRDYIVHDGTWYFIYSRNNTLRFRVDNDAEDRLSLTIPRVVEHGKVYFKALGVFDNKIHIVITHRDHNEAELLTVDIDTFEHDLRTVLDFGCFPYYYYLGFWGTKVYYIVLDTNWPFPDQDETRHYVMSYDLATNETRGPHLYYVGDSFLYGFTVDSKGNVHALIDRYDMAPRFMLFKISPAGEVIGRKDLDRYLVSNNVNMHFVNLEINGTDCLYMVGPGIINNTNVHKMMVWVFPSDYGQGDIHYVVTGGSFYYQITCIMTPSDRLLIAWDQMIQGLRQVHFLVQTPISPDLLIDRTSFWITEHASREMPIEISFDVINLGRGRSEGHWVEVATRTEREWTYRTLGDVQVTTEMAPGETHSFNLSSALPRGDHLLRMWVHDVGPFENVRDNNVLEILYYASVNNAPRVEVSLPTNGSVHTDTITVSGRTTDIDGDADVHTIVKGLPLDPIVGTGGWTRVVDLTQLPSGDHVLEFQAYDGQSWSGIEYRTIRIDHPEDSLIYGSHHPDWDVELVVGDAFTFQHNVTERFDRPITYLWFLSEELVGTNLSHLTYLADRAGKYALHSEASNGLTTLRRTWSVSVREPYAPAIVGSKPLEKDLSIFKHNEIDFSIDISNPDDVPLTVIWSLDNTMIITDHSGAANLTFHESGNHLVTAVLFTVTDSQSVSWNVSVINRAPSIVGAQPTNPRIEIRSDERMEFSIEVLDIDGDPVSYSWTFTNLTASSQNSSSIEILLPYVSGMSSVVRVEFTDGEAIDRYEWDIVSEPSKVPDTDEDPGYRASWREYLAIALIIGVVAVAFWYKERVKKE
jgi:hypothetical protein